MLAELAQMREEEARRKRRVDETRGVGKRKEEECKREER